MGDFIIESEEPIAYVPAPLGRDQRGEDLLVACHCHGHHYLRVYCDLDELPHARMWFVEVTARPSGFLARFKYAWKALMGGSAMESMEVCFDEPSAEAVHKYFERTRSSASRKEQQDA